MQEYNSQQFTNDIKKQKKSLMDFLIGPIVPERWSDNKKFYVLLLVLLAGFVYSIISIPLLGMGFGNVSSIGMYVFFGMYLLGIPLIMTGVVMGFMNKSKNMARALFWLQMPFFYGIFVVVIALLLSLLSI